MKREDFVSFEVAKLLKEKGFDKPLRETYDTIGLLYLDGNLLTNNLGACGFECVAPTIREATDWLDEKGFYISVEPFDIMQIARGKIVRFVASVYMKHSDCLDDRTIGVFNSRREATEAAMMNILVNL